jgi:hypothetical protein
MMREKYHRALPQLALLISLAALIFFSYGWRLQSRVWELKVTQDYFNYDEGIHLILGKLWAAGYIPYEQIFVSYPPVFIWSLGLPWKLFQQVEALQLVMATYALLGVIGVVYLGTVYHSRLAGIAAGVFLSFIPDYFIPSFAVMGEVQSVGVAVLSIALAEKYRRGGGWLWLVLAGSTLAFSLSLKVLPVYALPLIGLIVISRHVSLAGGWPSAWENVRSAWPSLLRDGIILAGSFLVVFFIPFLFFNLAALYDQVFGMRFISRETEFNPFESNTLDIVNFIFDNVSLTLLALAGLVFVILPDLRRYWLLLAWLILLWLSMRLHVPLRPKHLPVFLPILALLAGLGLAYFFNFLKQLNQTPFSLRTVTLLLMAGITLVMGLWEAPQIIARNSGRAIIVEENTARLKALDFIQTIITT